MSKLDRKIQEIIEAAYLWLFDQIGLTVGLLLFTSISSAMFIRDASPRPYLFTMLSVTAICSGYVSWLQTRSIKRFNKQAEASRKSPVRKGFTLLCLFMIGVDSMQSRLGPISFGSSCSISIRSA
jgi:hypothetical protein